MTESTPSPLGNVITIDDERIKNHLGRVVRGSVEETSNALLDAEADRLCNAQRHERSEARRDTRAGHYERKLQTKANLLERLFVEERRRLKIIPNAFGERAVLKLMFGALIRAAERWRSIKITEFERRQITAVRKELDQEYEAAVGLVAKPSKDEFNVKITSESRT